MYYIEEVTRRTNTMIKMVDTEMFGRVPVLGTIKDCEPTADGWRGTMPDGSVFETRGYSGSKPLLPKGHVIQADSDGHIVSAWLIRNKRRAKQKPQ
jgi:hypothetical protein